MSGLSVQHEDLFVSEEICWHVGTDFVYNNISDNAQGDAIDKPLAQPDRSNLFEFPLLESELL